MRLSCSHFEVRTCIFFHYLFVKELEATHLTRMCEFFGRFAEALVQSRSTDLSLVTDFNKQRSSELTPNRFLFNMIEERGTGRLEPLPAEFEDVEVAAAFPNTTDDVGCDGNVDTGLLSQPSSPRPLHLLSDSNSLRAASALPGQLALPCFYAYTVKERTCKVENSTCTYSGIYPLSRELLHRRTRAYCHLRVVLTDVAWVGLAYGHYQYLTLATFFCMK